MPIWKSPINLQEIAASRKNTLVDHLGIEFIEIGEDYLTGKMPVDQRTKQPYGILHGGASCALAETLGSVAGNFCVDNREFLCVGLDININHLRMARRGYVIGIATPLHLGKSTQVWEIKIRDEADCLIAVSRLTLAIISRRKGPDDERGK